MKEYEPRDKIRARERREVTRGKREKNARKRERGDSRKGEGVCVTAAEI